MLAKGSAPWIATVLIFTIISGAGTYLTKNPYMELTTYIGAISFVFLLRFFRDPERNVKMCKNCMIAPADGKVIDIRGRTVCIFMNFQNVHVNRTPLAGIIRNIEHKKGGYMPAFCKDSDRNERNKITIDTEHGEVNVTQIAGTITRRIITYVKEGDITQQGQRFGMIRFGSRVDITIPDLFDILCKKGDKVYAGETVIAMKNTRNGRNR
ncbi:MAG TPA: phosphatidylserine decarboxylase [Methanosarcinaceae archaeon]|nr:phosphatidylserine decarboxylase [Methanosarcinaceae archaeon]